MTDVSSVESLLLLAGGFIAGCINTLAGYGSIICLTILMDVIGLPANIANGSNRLNVLSTGIIGTLVFYKAGKLDLQKGRSYVVITFLGAMVGVYLATVVSNETFRGIFKYLVIVLFILLIVNPKKWLITQSEITRLPWWISLPVFFLIGLYGGFIQMGVGLLLLAILVLGARFTLIEANALKIFITCIYTIVVTLIFWYRDLIAWEAGIILAIGSTGGGWITSRFASSYPQANLWAYRLLVVMIIIIIFYQFNLFP